MTRDINLTVINAFQLKTFVLKVVRLNAILLDSVSVIVLMAGRGTNVQIAVQSSVCNVVRTIQTFVRGALRGDTKVIAKTYAHTTVRKKQVRHLVE